MKTDENIVFFQSIEFSKKKFEFGSKNKKD